jgi:putative endopeptidase
MTADHQSPAVSGKTIRRAPACLAAALLVASAACYTPPLLAADHAAMKVAGPNAAITPGDDFYQFVNAQWEASTTIPDGYNSWSVGTEVRDNSLKNMLALYQKAALGGPGISSSAHKVGLFNAAQLDRAGIEAKGMTPIAPTLAKIAALADLRALSRYLGSRMLTDVNPVSFASFSTENLFGLYIAPGLNDPEHYMAYMLQGGLGLAGLAGRDSYLSGEAADKKLLDQYRAYIAAMLSDAGIADAASKAEQIVALETRIARTHASAQASADLAASGQRWQFDDFQSRAAGMDWHAFFDGAGLSKSKVVGAWQPDAIRGISELVATTPLAAWKDYLSFHAINQNARFLPQSLAERHFAFYDPLFIGPGQHRPLWVRVLNQTNAVMPGAGQLFSETHFSPEAKARAEDMVANIVRAFDARIARLTWMTPATKKQARAKLNNMMIGVAYPDSWPDNSALEIRPDDAFGNVQRAKAFNHARQLAKLGRRVDRKEWIFAGELFGLNTLPLQNAMNIPVVQLQAPLFDAQGSDAANYAGIGTRIGTAIALTLQQQGSRFDAHGRVRSWWTKADRDLLKKASAPLASQFSGYQALPGVAVNGERSLDNNVAELAGLLAAHDAWRATLATRPGKADARTADQQFFLAYAQSLRVKVTEQALRGQVLGGSRVAPSPFRAATVRNLDAWYSAYEVSPGQGLYLAPAERVRIW